MKKELLGYCAVDSGQLIIVDPCYLREWKDGGSEDNSHYGRACALTVTQTGGGQMTVAGIAGDGVVFASGWGDGNYPVLASRDADGRIIKVEIDMR
jgi:Protein of unknown function (DUF4241)